MGALAGSIGSSAIRARAALSDSAGQRPSLRLPGFRSCARFRDAQAEGRGSRIPPDDLALGGRLKAGDDGFGEADAVRRLRRHC